MLFLLKYYYLIFLKGFHESIISQMTENGEESSLEEALSETFDPIESQIYYSSEHDDISTSEDDIVLGYVQVVTDRQTLLKLNSSNNVVKIWFLEVKN